VIEMIYRLEIENFYSFRDKQVLDLTVPLNVPPDEERFRSIFKGSKHRVPKVVALFGANASGKSTVLRAISFLAWFVKNSFEHRGPLPLERFNDQDSIDRPIKLAIEFGASVILHHSEKGMSELSEQAQGTSRYEIELVPHQGYFGKVATEALSLRPNREGRWQRVFARKPNKRLLGSKHFPLTGFAQVIDKIRDDASAVTTLAQFNHPQSKSIIDAATTIFSNILIDKLEPSDIDVFSEMVKRPILIDRLGPALQRIDLGIETVELGQLADGLPTLQFQHQGHGGKMPWVLESHGTRSFIRVFPWLIAALETGGIALLDELDVSIHPLVLPEIVRWFYSPSRNPNGAQLWMSCHAVSLLEDMAKEEVVLCEKDRSGRSKMYSLADVRPVLRKDNYYRKYLGGEYGAVPRIG
jgi:uncharacterized protein